MIIYQYRSKSIRPGYKHVGWGYASSANKFNQDNGINCVTYGDKFITNGDTIKCVFNFDSKTIEYYLNGKSLGIAFNNLKGSVKPAVSMYRVPNCVELLNVE